MSQVGNLNDQNILLLHINLFGS